MTTSTIEYVGSLRVEGKHTKSNVGIFSDAPTDNKGKGEGFSPTDYCATSLAMCMLTIAGIYADENFFSIEGTSASVIKVMDSAPRRISEINVKITFRIPKDLDGKLKRVIKSKALNCPVAKSLHPSIKQNVEIQFIS